MFKRSIILVLALVMAFSAIGSIYAQDPTRGQDAADQVRAVAELNRIVVETAATALGLTPQAFIESVEIGQSFAEVITANGGDLAQITADAKATAMTEIDNALSAGTITAEQAENMRANLDTALERVLNRPRVEREHRERAIINFVRVVYQSAADALGMTSMDILQNAEDGQTLNDYLVAQGADVAAVKAAAVASTTEGINTALTEGKITQEQADAALANLEANVDRVLNAPIPKNLDGKVVDLALDMSVINHAAEILAVPAQDIIQARNGGQSVADFVTANGGDPAAVAEATIVTNTARINTAVTNGNLPQEQADTMIAGLPAAVDEALNRTEPLPDPRQAERRPNDQLSLGVTEVVAEALGLDLQSVIAEFQAGKTLREIITENGGDIDAITLTIKDAVTTAIQTALANGEMIQERADAILGDLDTFIQRALDRTPLRDRLGRDGFDDSGEGEGVLE